MAALGAHEINCYVITKTYDQILSIGAKIVFCQFQGWFENTYMLSILLLPFAQDNAEDSAYNDNLVLLQYHFITLFFCNTVFEQTWHFGGFKLSKKRPINMTGFILENQN